MQGQREILSPYNHSTHLTRIHPLLLLTAAPCCVWRRAELSDADVGWIFTTCRPAPSLSLSHIHTCLHTPSHPLFFTGPAEGKFSISEKKQVKQVSMKEWKGKSIKVGQKYGRNEPERSLRVRKEQLFKCFHVRMERGSGWTPVGILPGFP